MLRVLQDGEIRRLGGSECIKTDVRLISATNQNLKQKIEEKTFREDLFYRINVIIIHVPPLRDRLDDIPLLADKFIEHYAAKLGKNIKGISPQVMERFYRYMWPGNIREFRNIIERAVVMSNRGTIQPADLPPNFNENIARFPRQTRQTDMPFRAAKEELERIYFADLLRRVNGNISQASQKSGVDRKTVRKLVTKYKIDASF
jgi:transcriptional regulator with PAS, ATPase and Fis domain